MDGYSDEKHFRDNEELLPQPAVLVAKPSSSTRKLHVLAAFVAGVVACFSLVHFFQHSSSCDINQPPALFSGVETVGVYASPWAGSSEVHNFPPPSPTNADPSLFPTNVGFPGHTATGAEAAVVVTAPSYPIHTGAPGLVAPAFEDDDGEEDDDFDLFRHWGNLSPWFTVKKGAFGVNAKPDEPDTCSITGVHLLHRHGARYPTSFGELCSFISVIHISSAE